MLIGVDEAGRGAWAGPLVAAAVTLQHNKKFQHPLIRDSKKLSALQRREVFDYVVTLCTIGVGVVTAEEIDQLGLQKANVVAVERAVKQIVIDQKQYEVVIDYIGAFGRYTSLENKYSLHKFGEQKFLEIAAASVIAKVTRDRMMENFAKEYPRYQFDLHKGYGTKLHQEKLKKYGASSIHRRSFSPLKLNKEEPRRRQMWRGSPLSL